MAYLAVQEADVMELSQKNHGHRTWVWNEFLQDFMPAIKTRNGGS